MSGIAIAFFVLAAVVVWGGLAVSIAYLMRHPRSPLEAEPEPPTSV